MTEEGFDWNQLYSNLGAPVDSNGHARWPTTWQTLVWDLGPESVAPAQDGVTPPSVGDAASSAIPLPDGALEDALEIARKSHERAISAVGTSEAKASRLLTPTVTLAVASAALSGVVIRWGIGTDQAFSSLVLGIPPLVATVFFVVAALKAADADLRVGLYGRTDLATVIRRIDREDPSGSGEVSLKRASLYGLMESEELANWSQVQKATGLMAARAWLTRAVLLLLLSTAIAAVTLLEPPSVATPSPSPVPVVRGVAPVSPPSASLTTPPGSTR